jgi:chromosome partitioning protein
VSPVNESFIDVDVFSRVHHDRSRRGHVAHYADLVLEARRKRRLVDNGIIDWVLVRNRSLSIQSNNARQVGMSLQRMSADLQFRVAEGLHDRVIFRELFPIGLTALDPIETAVQNQTLTSSQLSGRREIETLVQTLRLPVHQPGMQHLEARHRWYEGIAHFYRNLAASGGD